MYCPKCGKNIPDNSRFCTYCGNTIGSATPTKASKAPKAPKPKKPGSTKLLKPVLSLLLCILLLLGSVAYFILPSVLADGDMDPSAPSPTPSDEPSSSLSYDLKAIEKHVPDTSTIKDSKISKTAAQSYMNDVANLEAAVEITEVELGEAFGAAEGEVSPDVLDNYLYEMGNFFALLCEAGEIESYEVCDTGILITMNSGAYYFYAPEVDGIDANGDDELPELFVATYQPCLESYRGGSAWQYVNFVDDAAELIDNTFDTYSFNDSANYDNDEVDTETCSAMGQYNVILWHGHGAYSQELGPMPVTGIEITNESVEAYGQAIENGSLVFGSSTFLMTSAYVDNYIEDGSLDNSIVYLGTCSSGRDARLATALLSKGAEAVYANSNVISTRYNLEMIDAVSRGLCELNGSGYNNVFEALEFAREEVADVDPYYNGGARVLLYTENEAFALDWYENMMTSDRSVVLALDASGSMSGEPMSETKEASHRFVSSVLDQNAVVSVLCYGDWAISKCGFTANANALDEAIDGISEMGMTNTYEALLMASEQLDNVDSRQKIIVLMSDGMPNEGLCGDDLIAFADEIKERGISIYTLGFFQSLSSSDTFQAQQLMEALASDGCHYEVATASDLEFFFTDIAEQVNGQRYIYIRIACPVEVTVSYKGETLCSDEDDLNTRTSFGTLSFENTEDGEDSVKILRLKEGAKYDISIKGTGSGRMDYTIGLMDEDGNYSDFRRFENIKITRNTTIDTVASTADKTYLSVDSDGDGRYDVEYVAGENEKAEPVDKTLDYIVMGIGAASLIGIVVCILIISARVKRRKAAPAAA